MSVNVLANQTSDSNIFPVGNSMNMSNYMVDGVTNLTLNNYINNSNVSDASYFDISKKPDIAIDQNIFNNFYFNDRSNIESGRVVYGDIQSDTNQYLNLNKNNSNIYTMDILNTSSTDTEPIQFISLTNLPYTNTFLPDEKFNPVYFAGGSSSVIVRSSYCFSVSGDILIIRMIFTITNTQQLDLDSSGSTLLPCITLKIYNEVYYTSTATNVGNYSNTKSYGPYTYNLNYTSGTFNPTVASYSENQNIQLVFVPGFSLVSADLVTMFVPGIRAPGLNYITQDDFLVIDKELKVETKLGRTPSTFSNTTGYFGVAFVYKISNNYYNSSILSQNNTITSVWRSPISIYNSYNSYTLNDLVLTNIIVLFGKTTKGGTFVVLNSGTPINIITSYSVTTLYNFINIMSAISYNYDSNYALIDYFINSSLINRINNVYDYNITPLYIQSILAGSIVTPNISNNLYYFLLNSKNNFNLSIEPIMQNSFNGLGFGINYFGLASADAVGIGNLTYAGTEVSTLTTNNNYCLPDTIFLGLNSINNTSYFVCLILPESLFTYSIPSNVLNLYSNNNSIFYVSTSNNVSSQFNSQNNITQRRTLTVSNTAIINNV